MLLGAGLIGNLIFGASTLVLPDMMGSLGLSTSGAALVVALYSVGFAASLVVGGRLGDARGRRTVLRIALAAVVLSSLLVAAAPGPILLGAGRTVQGIASGLVLPQVLSTIQHTTTGRIRARWTGLYAAVIGAGTAIGQLGAGILVDAVRPGLGWRLSYALVAAVALVPLLLSGSIPSTRAARAGRVDAFGAILLGLGVAGIALPLGLGSIVPWWATALLLLGAVALIATFVRWERHVAPEHALMPPAVVRNAPLRRGLALTFLFFAGYGSFVYYFTATMQNGLGAGPLETAVLLLPFTAGFVCVSVLLPSVLGRRPAVPVMMVGTAVQGAMLIGLAMLMTAGWPAPPRAAVIVVFVVLGAAQAMMYGPLIGTVMDAVPRRLAGLASGLFSTMQQLGFALGIPVFGLILAGLGRDPARAFAVCVAGQLTLGLTFFLLLRRHGGADRSSGTDPRGRGAGR